MNVLNEREKRAKLHFHVHLSDQTPSPGGEPGSPGTAAGRRGGRAACSPALPAPLQLLSGSSQPPRRGSPCSCCSGAERLGLSRRRHEPGPQKAKQHSGAGPERAPLCRACCSARIHHRAATLPINFNPDPPPDAVFLQIGIARMELIPRGYQDVSVPTASPPPVQPVQSLCPIPVPRPRALFPIPIPVPCPRAPSPQGTHAGTTSTSTSGLAGRRPFFAACQPPRAARLPCSMDQRSLSARQRPPNMSKHT